MIASAGVATRNLAQYVELHRARPYGRSGHHRRSTLEPLIRFIRPKSILDYGAGQSVLVNEFEHNWIEVRHRFDPAIPDIASIPLARYDLTICTDVLEHLDETEIDPILRHIHSISPNALFTIHTGEARTILPNGENAHATVRPGDWWAERIALIFGDSTLVSVRAKVATVSTFRPPVWTLWRLRRKAAMANRRAVG